MPLGRSAAVRIGRHAVEHGNPGNQFQAPLREPPNRPRQDVMFLFEHPGREYLGRVIAQHRHPRLDDHRSTIEFRGYEVDAGAVLGGARLDRASVSVKTGEGGQQRGIMLISRPR